MNVRPVESWTVAGTSPERAGRHLEAVLSAPDLVVRCAWCERIRVGDGWVAAPADLDPQEASHTICSSCFADLRARGLSA